MVGGQRRGKFGKFCHSGRVTGLLSTCIADDLLCVRSHKTDSPHWVCGQWQDSLLSIIIPRDFLHIFQEASHIYHVTSWRILIFQEVTQYLYTVQSVHILHGLNCMDLIVQRTQSGLVATGQDRS